MKYFVSYSISKNGEFGFGHTVVELNLSIQSEIDIVTLCNHVKDKMHADCITILNWIPLNTSER